MSDDEMVTVYERHENGRRWLELEDGTEIATLGEHMTVDAVKPMVVRAAELAIAESGADMSMRMESDPE